MKYKSNFLSIIYTAFSLISISLSLSSLIFFTIKKQLLFGIHVFIAFITASLFFITLSEIIKLLSNIRENTEKLVNNTNKK